MRKIGLVAIAAAMALAACGDGGSGGEATSVADHTNTGVPTAPDFEGLDDWTYAGVSIPGWGLQPVVGWLTEGETFAVVTWGSSACVYVATEMKAAGDAALSVEFTLPEYEACTDDLAALTHVFTLPEAVTERPITVTITGVDQSGWIAGDAGLSDVTLELR